MQRHSGDGANLTNITAISGGTIGVSSEGTFVGAGITMVDFKSTNGTNTCSVTVSGGIATVNCNSRCLYWTRNRSWRLI